MDCFIHNNNAVITPQTTNYAPQPVKEGKYWKDNKVG